MIGNNSCGVHSVMGGRTSDNLLTMEVVTYDGTRLQVGETSEATLETIRRQGGRRGEIYAALLRLRDDHAEAIRRLFPTSRAAYPVTTCRTCCRRKDSTWPAPWSAAKAPA